MRHSFRRSFSRLLTGQEEQPEPSGLMEELAMDFEDLPHVAAPRPSRHSLPNRPWESFNEGLLAREGDRGPVFDLHLAPAGDDGEQRYSLTRRGGPDREDYL